MDEIKKKYLHEYTVDQVINEVSLYQELYIDLSFIEKYSEFCNESEERKKFEFLRNVDADIFNKIIYKAKKIESFCCECGKERVFEIVNPNQYIEDKIPNKSNLTFFNGRDTPVIIDDCIFADNQVEDNSNFTRMYKCSKDDEHKIVVHFVLKANDKELFLVKVGQYPSIADIAINKYKYRKYEKYLKKDYTELYYALLARSIGMNIAAVTYLRRIYENLIDEAHDEHKKDYGWEEFEYNKFRSLPERIKYIKKFEPCLFPSELEQDKNSIYDVLCLGVHEYNERRCRDIFQHLLNCIESIVEYKFDKNQKENKIKESKKIIGKAVETKRTEKREIE